MDPFLWPIVLGLIVLASGAVWLAVVTTAADGIQGGVWGLGGFGSGAWHGLIGLLFGPVGIALFFFAPLSRSVGVALGTWLGLPLSLCTFYALMCTVQLANARFDTMVPTRVCGLVDQVDAYACRTSTSRGGSKVTSCSHHSVIKLDDVADDDVVLDLRLARGPVCMWRHPGALGMTWIDGVHTPPPAPLPQPVDIDRQHREEELRKLLEQICGPEKMSFRCRDAQSRA